MSVSMDASKVFLLINLYSRLTSLMPALREDIRSDLISIAEDIVMIAKGLVPVDTGALKESIRVEEKNKKVYATAGGGGVTNPKTGRIVDYAAHVEYGTSRVPAHPYMRPAFDRVRKEIKQEIRNTIKEFIVSGIRGLVIR